MDLAACVFSRKEYANMNAWSNRILRIASRVSLCSSSVSPQKPAITSVEMVTPGITCRALSISSKNVSLEYPLRILLNTLVDPDWIGIWMDLQMFGVRAMVSSTSNGKSFGCGEVNRTLSSGSTDAIAVSRSANRAPGRLRTLPLNRLLNPGVDWKVVSGNASMEATDVSWYPFTFCPEKPRVDVEIKQYSE